jgi:hypothetical protein
MDEELQEAQRISVDAMCRREYKSTAHFCKYIRANALVCASGESESPCLHETNSERFLTVAITT